MILRRVTIALSSRTDLGFPVGDESNQLVVLYLERFLKHLRDDEAVGGLPVDDTATVELLEYPEEHFGVVRDVVTWISCPGIQLWVPRIVEVDIEGEDVLGLKLVQVNLARGKVDLVPERRPDSAQHLSKSSNI